MTVIVDDILGPEFSTKSLVQGDRVAVQLIGCLDLDAAPVLRHFLSQFTRRIQAGEVLEFEFDIEQLYLLSSSAISHFAIWLKDLKAAERVRRVKFRTNPNLAWQRRSLDALRRLAQPLVNVE
jgi:hypothetical protein